MLAIKFEKPIFHVDANLISVRSISMHLPNSIKLKLGIIAKLLLIKAKKDQLMLPIIPPLSTS